MPILSYISVAGSFILAFIITWFTLPVIIKIARLKGLVSRPNRRTVHFEPVPTIGGVGIFIGFILSFLLFADLEYLSNLQYFLFAIILIFFMGFKDDIIAIGATAKFAGLFIAIIFLIILGDIQIQSFYGLFGIYELNYWISVGITAIVFLSIINAVNLIDGIDGLCAMLSMVSLSAFGFCLYLLNHSHWGVQLIILTSTLIGALLAFLRYNISKKKKIFMGDTGSLLIGFIIAFLAVMLIRVNDTTTSPYKFTFSPVIVFGFLIIPLCDMIKVFFVRIYRGKSPFKADKRHIHHLLIDLGLSHIQSSLLLSTTSVFLIFLLLWIQAFGSEIYMLPVLSVGFLIVYIPNIINRLRGYRIRKTIKKHT